MFLPENERIYPCRQQETKSNRPSNFFNAIYGVENYKTMIHITLLKLSLRIGLTVPVHHLNYDGDTDK